MHLFESMKSHYEQLQEQISRMEKKLAVLPEGVLHIVKVGKYYAWKWYDKDGKEHYIPKSDESLAVKLALRKFYTAFIHDLKAEAEASRRYLWYREHSTREVEKLIRKASPEFIRLLGHALKTDDKRITAWENEPYEKSTRFPEGLRFRTLKEGEYVRSKIEAMVAACLMALGIPYKYEKILHIDRLEIAPDFTVLDVRTFQEIPLEVFGMMDDPEYRQNYKRKMKTYIDEDYIPGVNMLTFYESQREPLSQGVLMEDLTAFFFRKAPIML